MLETSRRSHRTSHQGPERDLYYQAGEMHPLFPLVSSGEKAGNLRAGNLQERRCVLSYSEFGWMLQEHYICITKKGPRIEKQADRILISTCLIAIEYGFISS